MRKRGFTLSGYVIELEDFIDTLETIISNFASLGWQKLLTCQKNYYPSFVYEFYANLKILGWMKIESNGKVPECINCLEV